MKKLIISISVIIFVINSSFIGVACTGFTKSDENKVLVGLNEDNYPSSRYVEIYPPKNGKFGKIFFGYEGWGFQQMINDQGLLWDGFWAPHLDITNGEGKPKPSSWIDEWMDTCSTVDEIADIYNSFDWRDSGIEDAMLFFVDRYGNSAIIEGDEIIYKNGDYQIVTNFYQSHPELGGSGFDRYDIVVDMFENMNSLSMQYFKDICRETYSDQYTIYSIVCNLTNNSIHYYYDGEFQDVWKINLSEEFQFDQHSYNVSDVFNNHKPNKPNKPAGLKSGFINKTYEYSSSVLDIDGDLVYFKWDWGDGNISQWMGPYYSGEKCSKGHLWHRDGAYSIRVKARDINCGISDWSDPLVVSMPINKLKWNNNLWIIRLVNRFPFLDSCL